MALQKENHQLWYGFIKKHRKRIERMACMESYIQAFCEYRKEKKQVSENTMLAYRSDLMRMVNYLRGNGIVSVEQVTETQLNSFILSAEREGLKASSIVRLISSVHSFFDFL